MTSALRAEWTKLRTLPGTGWLLLGVVAATVTISATVSAAVSCSSPAGCHVDVTKLSLTGADLGQAVVAIVAVLAGRLRPGECPAGNDCCRGHDSTAG